MRASLLSRVNSGSFVKSQLAQLASLMSCKLFSIVIFLCLASTAQAWFDNDWTYRATFTANNPGLTLSDQQIKINLNSANVHPDYVWSSNGDDIRALFSDDITPLDYYIENWDQGSETASILIRIGSLPPGDTAILLYYGNAGAADESNPIAVLTEIGLRYHTRQSSLDPFDRIGATSEFDSLGDSITGYGCKTVTSFTSINNNGEFPGGVNSNILFFSNNHFEVPPTEAGTWNFRFGGDYGRGGGMYLDNIDSDEKWGDDLWWGFSFANTAEILEVSGTLSAGFHNLQMLGAEGCCDGGTSIEYQSPANPGVWRVWSTGNVNIRSEKCEVVNISTTVTSSSLVSSTKTALDLNGGDLEIGDVIRYTITLNESSGNSAEHVSLIDDIAPQLMSLNVVTIPAGAIDNSILGGGAHSTGLVSVDNINVPANSSVTVVFDVTVTTVPVAQTIDNSATIENLSGGADVVVSAPTLVVSVNLLTSTGVKNLYLYSNNDLSRVVPTTDQSFVLIDEAFDSEIYTLNPALQAPLIVDKSIDQGISLYIRRAGETTYPTRTLRIQVAGSVSGVIAEYSNNDVTIPAGTAFSLFPLTLTYASPAPLTLALGETISLEIINESNDFISGGAGPVWNDDIEMYLSNITGVTPNTILNFPSNTVINIDTVDTYENAYPTAVLKTTFSPGDTVYIRSVVSDPFGINDIESATVDVTDASGGITAGLVMTEVDAAGALKTFEFVYNIVGLPPQGSWSAMVTANEGTEGTISDTGAGSFNVFFPPTLMTVVSSNVPSAVTGSTVIYTIVTTNTGTGDAISVTMNNAMPLFTSLRLNTYGASTPFNCSAGCPASGVALGLPVYSDDGAVSFTYSPTSGGGGAPPDYDANVTDWEIPMTGVLPGSSTAFTIEFETIVE